MPRCAPCRQAAAFASPPSGQELWRLRKARGRRQICVRWCVPCDHLSDPWRLASGRGPPAAAWQAADCSWVAFGRAWEVRQPLRPAGLRQIRQLRQGAVAVGEPEPALWAELPLWLGASAFFAATPQAWAKRPAARPTAQGRVLWPAARPWFVPAVLCWRSRKTTALVLSAALPLTATGCAALAKRWRREAARWQIWVDLAAGPVPPLAAVPRAQAARLAKAARLVEAARLVDAARLAPLALESRAEFVGRVGRALEQLARGPLRKVVLARAVRVLAPQGQRLDGFASAQRLRALHPQAKVFYFAHPRGGAWVGATPELLAQVTRGQFTGHALAGTRTRGTAARTDALARAELLASAKDQAEHAAVVSGLRRALRPCCKLQGSLPAPVAQATRQLWHLHTPVTGRLRRGYDVLDLVLALHPTPAVGGTPTPLALRILARQEGWRGDYAGPVGWVAQDGGCFAVAIRSVLFAHHHATAFAGAGIVPGSEPEAEWRETQAKLTTALGGLVCTPLAGA